MHIEWNLSLLRMISLAACLFLFNHDSSARQGDPQKPLASGWEEVTRFSRSIQSETAEIWGVGRQFRGVYPSDDLTSIFERKISFDKISINGDSFKWIFTGRYGGFTVVVKNDTITLLQRFYDSFGLHGERVPSSPAIPRYANAVWLQVSVPVSEAVRELGVSMSHDLQLELSLNGRRIARQECLIDVDRHQITFDGVRGEYGAAILKPTIKEVAVRVDRSKRFQTILGFGATTSVMAYGELSDEGKEKWWKLIREYNMLIHREYPIGQMLKPDLSNWDKKEDAVIHYYGDNYPNGEIVDFAYNKRIQDMGGIVVFEFWKLPAWMYKLVKDKDGKEKRIVDEDRYATTMLDYCRQAKAKTGKAPAILGIQNEVAQSADVWYAMTTSLRRKLDENGFGEVKIHMHNHTSLEGSIDALKKFKSRKEMWDAIDYSAANMYDYQNFFINPDSFDIRIAEWQKEVGGKTFMSTELCVNESRYQHLSYRIAFQMGQLYHKNLTKMDAICILYCWGLLNGPHASFDGTRSLFRVNRTDHSTPEPSSDQLRVYGAYSRHLLKGMQREEATSDDSDLLVSAFGKGNGRTMILMNRSARKMSVTFDASGFREAEVTDQFSANRKAALSRLVRGGKLQLEPGQIITLF